MTTQLTVEKLGYSPHVRVANAILEMVKRLGFNLCEHGTDELIATAIEQTGLSDFGGTEFIEPMRVIEANARKKNFEAIGQVFTRQAFLKALTQRLRKVEYLKQHPEILDIPIEKPIFILGFPRTGTTVTQNLLAANPKRRGLQFWELVTPLPADPDPLKDIKKRKRTADWYLRASYLLNPEQATVHKVGRESYEECWYLLANSFTVLNYDFQSGYDEYYQWILNTDITWAYKEFKEWLQILSYQQPGKQFLLKCPEHLWFIDNLLEVFPDARIIWTHRDPARSIASYCSYMTMWRRQLYGHVDPLSLGAQIVDRFHTGIERAMASREKAKPGQFYDVNFRDVIADPKGVVNGICEHFDLENPPDFQERMTEILSNKAEQDDAQGRHIYDAPRYGLDDDEIRALFADYIKAYDISIR